MKISIQNKEFMHHQFIITVCTGLIFGGLISQNVNESPLYGAFIGFAISSILALTIYCIPVKSVNREFAKQ